MAKLVSLFISFSPLSAHILALLNLLLTATPATGWSFDRRELNYTNWKNTSVNTTESNVPTRDICNLTVWSRNTWNQSGVDDWLQKRLTEFRNNPPAGGNDFVKNFLKPAFAPGVSDTLNDCIVEHECELFSNCNDFQGLDDRIEAAKVQQVMKAIANLNGVFHDVIVAIDVANEAFSQEKDSLVARFTFTDEWDVYEDKMKHKKDQELALAFTALTVVAALASLPLLPAAAGAAGAAVGGAATAKAATAITEKLAGTFSGTTFAGANGYNFIQGLQDKFDTTDTGENHEWVAIKEISKTMGEAYLNTRDQMLNLTQKIIAGHVVSNNTDLTTFLSSGIYAQSTHEVSDAIQTVMREYWFSWFINQLWVTERVWILMVDVPAGSTCTADIRGPPEAKVCLPEFENLIFFFYALPSTGESKNKEVADLQTPPGWNEFSDKGFHGITKEKIARSSKAYFTRFGNSRNPSNLRNMSDFLKKPDFSMFSAGQPGLWTIPICYDRQGEQIGELKATDKSRLFPCVCGAHDNRPETEANRVQIMAEFLDATRLRYSYDYHCQCYSVDRQNCDIATGGGTLDDRYPSPPPQNFQPNNQAKCFKREERFSSVFKNKHEECLAVYPYVDCKGAGHHW